MASLEEDLNNMGNGCKMKIGLLCNGTKYKLPSR